MKTFSIQLIILNLFIFELSDQKTLIFDKPGTFEILNRTDYTKPECKFTQAEVTANLKKI